MAQYTEYESSKEVQLEGLKKGSLSPFAAGGLALAAFVPGVGAAIVPAQVALFAGNLSWLAIVVGTLAVLCVAVSVIVFARRFVVSGALYSYVNQVFGRFPTLVTASSILFAYVLATSLLLVAGAIYIGAFLTSLGQNWGTSPLAFAFFAIMISIIGGVTTYFGVNVSARLSVLLLLITLPLVLIITILLPFSVNLDVASQLDFAAAADVPFSSFLGGATLAIAVMILFESSTATAVETRDPKRSLPVIVIGVPVVLGVLYAASAFIQVPALGLVQDEIAAGASPISAIAGLVGLGWLGALIDLSLAIASVSAVIAFLNYGSRVAASMANDGVLPRGLARVHPRFGTPDRATFLVAALVIAFIALMLFVNGGDTNAVYSFNASLYALFVVVPYVLICVGAVVLLRREQSRHWPFVAVTALLGSAAFIWMLISFFATPASGALALVPYIYLVVLGIALVALMMYDRRPASRSRIIPGS